MENSIKKPLSAAINIDIGNLSLNVFCVGESPFLKSSSDSPNQNHIRATHSHFAYEVFFITSGRLKLLTDHDTKEYQSSILIIPPKIKHISVPIGGESYCLLFSFDGDSRFEEQLNQGVCELPITEDVAFYIKKFTEKVTLNTSFAKTDQNHLAALIFNNIFAKLKVEKAKVHNNKKHTSKHINAIDNYINKNILSKITLASVAEKVYLSAKQVSRIIESEYGCSFCTLITEKRLGTAAVMLKNTNLKISEIANQTFCGNEKYFYKVFKAKYGLSPLKYRNQVQFSANKNL